MKERTQGFLELNTNDRFQDSFSEFIEILNNLDLSEETLEHLNAVFIKDMKIYFEGE